MNHTDPIADMLTRVRNAQQAGHDSVTIPASKVKIALAHVLREEGFIRSYRCVRDGKQGLLKVALKYSPEGQGAITSVKRVSRPSLRRYVKASAIPFVGTGLGTAIVSTSAGLMSDRQARKAHLGGELICTVF